MVIEDYDLLKVIGKGSFGKVMQVRKKDTLRIYAMKIIRKANIIERDEVEHTIAERNVLAKINHPFIVNLKLSFQTSEKLYLVLAFVNGGEVRKALKRRMFYVLSFKQVLFCSCSSISKMMVSLTSTGPSFTLPSSCWLWNISTNSTLSIGIEF